MPKPFAVGAGGAIGLEPPLVGLPFRDPWLNPGHHEFGISFMPSVPRSVVFFGALALIVGGGRPIGNFMVGLAQTGFSTERTVEEVEIARTSLKGQFIPCLAKSTYDVSGKGKTQLVFNFFGKEMNVPKANTTHKLDMSLGAVTCLGNGETIAQVVNSEICPIDVGADRLPKDSVCRLPAEKRQPLVVKVPVSGVKTVVEVIDEKPTTTQGSLMKILEGGADIKAGVIQAPCEAVPFGPSDEACAAYANNMVSFFEKNRNYTAVATRASLIAATRKTMAENEWGDYQKAILDGYKDAVYTITKDAAEANRVKIVFTDDSGDPTDKAPAFSSLFDAPIAKTNEVKYTFSDANLKHTSAQYVPKTFPPVLPATSSTSNAQGGQQS